MIRMRDKIYQGRVLTKRRAHTCDHGGLRVSVIYAWYVMGYLVAYDVYR